MFTNHSLLFALFETVSVIAFGTLIFCDAILSLISMLPKFEEFLQEEAVTDT